MKNKKNRTMAVEGFSIVESIVGLTILSITSLIFFQFANTTSINNAEFSLKSQSLINSILEDYKNNKEQKSKMFSNEDLMVKAELLPYKKESKLKVLTLIYSLGQQNNKYSEKYLIQND